MANSNFCEISLNEISDDYISSDCIFIILSEKTIDYICNNYLRYHKEDSVKINALNKSIKSKFTFLDDNELTTIVTDERDWIVVRKAVRVKFCPCCGMRLRQHIFKTVVQTIKDSIRE